MFNDNLSFFFLTLNHFNIMADTDGLPLLADDLMRDRARQFVEFLDDETQANYNYRESIKRMLDLEQVRLIVNLDDVRDYDRTYADGWVDTENYLTPDCC